MHSLKARITTALSLLIFVAGLSLTSIPAAPAGDHYRSLDLPSPLCDKIQVPQGNQLAFHVYAQGFQVYRWNGATWDFVGPIATLSASDNFKGEVGIHYSGPTWESKSGSKVVAKRVDGCSPDANAIPWLLLETVSTNGPGIFSLITYIQRVNTTGGLIPSVNGSTVGELKEVPYTAEYFFYRAED